MEKFEAYYILSTVKYVKDTFAFTWKQKEEELIDQWEIDF